MIARVVIAAATAALLAGPALACSPAPFDAGTSESHGNCAMSYYDDEVTRRGTGFAEDLGGGFVSQYYTEGNACYMTASMIVIDCNAGEAVIFGPGPTVGAGAGEAPANDPFERRATTIETAAKLGKPMPLVAILGMARQGHFTNADLVSVPAKVGISNDSAAPTHSFDLGCGCALFYPGSAGAGQ